MEKLIRSLSNVTHCSSHPAKESSLLGICLISLESLIHCQWDCHRPHMPCVRLICKSELITHSIFARVKPSLHQIKVSLSFLYEVEILLSDCMSKHSRCIPRTVLLNPVAVNSLWLSWVSRRHVWSHSCWYSFSSLSMFQVCDGIKQGTRPCAPWGQNYRWS